MAQADSGWELVKPAAASGWEPVSAPEPSPASPNSDQFTANPHGEGLYDMTGPGGTIKVPFSKVQDANKSGYRLANTATMTRYANDARYKQQQDNPQSNYIPLEYADPEHPWNIREAGKALHNLYAGAANMVMHPLQTAAAMGTSQIASGMSPNGYPIFAPTGNQQRDEQNQQLISNAQAQAAAQGEEFRQHPLENAEAMMGQAALLDVAARVPGGAVKAARVATGTSPGVVADLAERTAADNATAAADAEETNIKAAQKHLDRTQDALTEQRDREGLRTQELRKKAAELREKDAQDAAARAENERLQREHEQAVQTQKQTQEHLNSSERAAKTDLKKVEDRVHTEADDRYKELKPKLAKVESDPETVAEIADNATEMLEPSVPKPQIFEKFQNFVKNNILTYDDLDGFRSTLSAALRKGNLPGPTYHLYEVMLEGDPERGIPGIIDEMDRIASDHGLKEEADAARAGWRAWAESFRDRTSPLRQVLDSPEQHGMLGAMRGKQSFLARLRAFGPDGAALADRIEADLATAQRSKAQFTKYGEIQIPAPKVPKMAKVGEPPTASPEERANQVVPNPERPAFPDRPADITPTPQKIGVEDVRAAKEESLINRRASIQKKVDRLASYGGGFAAIYNILRAHFQTGAEMVGGAALVYGGGQAIDALLRNPRVVEALTKPTAEDIAQIPPELRGQLGEFAQAAQARGIKVSPKVYAALGLALPQTRTQYIKDLRESHAFTDNGANTGGR